MRKLLAFALVLGFAAPAVGQTIPNPPPFPFPRPPFPSTAGEVGAQGSIAGGNALIQIKPVATAGDALSPGAGAFAGGISAFITNATGAHVIAP